MLHESGGARFGDGAQIVHHLIAGHTNTVVIDGDGFGVGVCAHTNPVISTAGKTPIANYRESMFIDCVRRIRDQLPQEDFPIGIERMNHEVKQTLRLGLKAHSLGRISCHDRFPCLKCLIEVPEVEVFDACVQCGGHPRLFKAPLGLAGKKKPACAGFLTIRYASKRSAAYQPVISWRAEPISASERTVLTPAASNAANFSSAVPFPPEIIAPAWPMRLPLGAVTPAI